MDLAPEENPNFKENPDIERVKEFQVRKLKREFEIPGMGECIGVVIHHPATKTAYAGHYVDLETKNPLEMIEDAKRDYGTLGETQTYAILVGGGYNLDSSSDEEEREVVIKRRELLIKLLTDNGISRDRIRDYWNSDNCYASFRFNPTNGVNHLKVAKLETDEVVFDGSL